MASARSPEQFSVSVQVSLSNGGSERSEASLLEIQSLLAADFTQDNTDYYVVAPHVGQATVLTYAAPLLRKIEADNINRFTTTRGTCTPMMIVLVGSVEKACEVFDVFINLISEPQLKVSLLTNRVDVSYIDQDAQIAVGMPHQISRLGDKGLMSLERLQWLVFEEVHPLLRTDVTNFYRDSILGAEYPRTCRTIFVDTRFLTLFDPLPFVARYHGDVAWTSILRSAGTRVITKRKNSESLLGDQKWLANLVKRPKLD